MIRSMPTRRQFLSVVLGTCSTGWLAYGQSLPKRLHAKAAQRCMPN